MRGKRIYILGIILLILASGFVALRSNSSVTKEESTCCKKNNTACPGENKKAEDLAPESLSRQFISITDLLPQYITIF